jgi:uncharacterized protein (TIGR01619 family)
MRISFTLLAVFAINTFAFAQEEGNWDAYIAQYDDGVGSTTVNMDLINEAPKKNLPFVVITGVTYKECDEHGFPSDDELDKLYKISDGVNETVWTATQKEMVGTFMMGCERLDYIYIRDTLQVRKKLIELYTSTYPTYEYYINIRRDDKWEAYVDFLYPNEETQEYMSNEKVLMKLSEAGDKLTTPRVVDHWLYFKSEKKMEKFIQFATDEKFKIEEKKHVKELDLPYQLHISRVDKIEMEYIQPITMLLRKKAQELEGKYDGWETVVIKD